MRSVKRSRRAQPYLFMLPAILLILFVYAGPMLATAGLSLTDWNGVSKNPNFVGLQNFVRIFTDKELLLPLKNTLYFTVLTVFFQCTLSLLLAVWLNKKFLGRNMMRTAFFLPCVVSMVAIGYAWSFLFNPVFGPIAMLAEQWNLPWLAGIKWLTDPDIVLNSLVFVNVWQWVGWSMVIYLAGLQGIPNDLYEAAAIDGASRTAQFFRITVPLLAPSITINVVMSTMGGLKAFDLMYVMTNGGPGHASESISMAIVSSSIAQRKAGLGSALSLVLFVLVLGVSLAQNKLLSTREEDAAI